MISADQIRTSYFQGESTGPLQLDREARHSAQSSPAGQTTDPAQVSLGMTGGRGTGWITGPVAAPATVELTPAARHILREVRRRLGAVSGKNLPSDSDLGVLVAEVEAHEGERLGQIERTSVVAALTSSLDDFDILTALIENQRVNDIIVSAYNDISIQIDRQNFRTDYKFADADSYRSFVENLLKRSGRSCTNSTPVVDAAIGSNIRICVTHESFSPPGCGPMMTIRVARHHAVSLTALVSAELAPILLLQYLEVLVRDCGATLLVSGEVGTGKTTLVRALAMAVDPTQSILIIEDTHEILLNRPFVRTLLTREANTEGAGRIEPAAAIRTGMRMAMNRLILGEMRDARAAESFVDVCSSGHCGMSTIHARSARDSLARLELFLGRAQGQVSSETIRKEIANAVSVIVHLAVDRNSNKRRIVEIVEVGAFSDGAIQQIPMFSFSAASRGAAPLWRREAGMSQFDSEMRHSGINLPAAGASVSL